MKTSSGWAAAIESHFLGSILTSSLGLYNFSQKARVWVAREWVWAYAGIVPRHWKWTNAMGWAENKQSPDHLTRSTIRIESTRAHRNCPTYETVAAYTVSCYINQYIEAADITSKEGSVQRYIVVLTIGHLFLFSQLRLRLQLQLNSHTISWDTILYSCS